jgi:hypothetical protein
MEDQMRPRFAILPLLVLLLGLSPAGAHDDPAGAHERAPGHTQRDLRQLAVQIVGGASLLVDVSPSASSVVEFHKRAHHFEESLGRSRDHVDGDWRDLRSAFRAASKAARRGRDPRIGFLLSHLEEDLAAGDQLVGAHASAPPPSGSVTGPGRLSFIDRETCVGTNRGAKACNGSRDTLTFSIPRDVTVISRLDAEWRDFGGSAKGEIYVNDRLVWRTDVARNWDTDAKSLDVRIPPGSTLSVRSSNGDPIWIRRLSAETRREADRDSVKRSPWDFLWPDRR